ncbi:hypothetical protein AAG906_002143 [Vitis piasezkii]
MKLKSTQKVIPSQARNYFDESNYDIWSQLVEMHIANRKNFPTSKVVMKDHEDIADTRNPLNDNGCTSFFWIGMKAESDNPDTLAMVVRQQSTRNWQDQSKTNHPKMTLILISQPSNALTAIRLVIPRVVALKLWDIQIANVDEKASTLISATNYGGKQVSPLDLPHKNLFHTNVAPSLNYNLLSVSQITAPYLVLSFLALNFKKKSEIWLWHRRLGHASFGYLKKLFPSLFAKSDISGFRCDICELAKSHRASFPLILNKSPSPFMVIHSDVWGPSKVPTLSGLRWFVTFIDDCTRMTWLCLMKTKDEVNLLFQNFHKMIETQYNAKVRVLRSDNGGEYQSSDLQKYLEGHGIIHQTTCSNTP